MSKFPVRKGKNRDGACHRWGILQLDFILQPPLRFLALVPAIACSAFIFYLSSLEGSDVNLPFQVKDKILHMIAFGVLTSTWVFGLRLAFGWSWTKVAWVSALFGALYGITDEVHQYYVPGRSAEVGDWIADAVGSMLVGLAVFVFGRRRS